MVWVDANEICGESSYYEDDRPTVDNFNNGNPVAPATVARIDNGCWGLGGQGESIEAHEMMHSLGSVMPTSPHSTILGHCTDDADRMCYQDALSIQVDVVCARTRRPSSTAARTTTSTLEPLRPAIWPSTGTRPAAPSWPRPTATIRSASSEQRSPRAIP